MTNKQKLELIWIGKDTRLHAEPRILLEDQEKSHHAVRRVSETDIFDNTLIFGDNLLALKALESEYLGKVKCVVIDPPYNTGSAFAQYDDGLEHSIWLGLMRDRLELLRRLMSNDGSLWMTIDDTESHYLKVLCDEIFGRANFVANVVWQKKSSPQSNSVWLSDSHDHILVYAKDKSVWRPNLLQRSEEANARYTNVDNDPRGAWTSGDFTISLTGGQRGAQFAKTGVSENIYEITTPSGRKLMPPEGRCWAASPKRYNELRTENRLYFGTTGNNVPRVKRFLSEVQDGIVCQTLWLRADVGDNQEAKREVKDFNAQDIFATPKPERLIARILSIATVPGDLVLDSFAGSGTTGAVAHKMGRRWIMVELGEHCHTHIIPRLKKVINGEDQGGISPTFQWNGGGGYRYFKLAPSLLEKDGFGNWVVSKQYNAEMLAQAVCKHMGFAYDPSGSYYFIHGHSSERDFLYVTTAALTHDELKAISEEVGPERTLLVCCKAFSANVDAFKNLTVKKIPNAILKKCEWGRDDYSLNVAILIDSPLAVSDTNKKATAQLNLDFATGTAH
jgi:adenine-specific DNA-methyltransferase